MNRREMLVGLGATALGLGLAGFPAGWAAEEKAPRRRILCFTKSSGFEHDPVKRKGGKLSLVEQTLTDLGATHGFDVTATKDGTIFTAENLATYDAIYFYTTGDLTQAGTDKTPPMTPEGKTAFLDAIHNGKGFIGTHAATDTFHTPGDRYKTYPIDERDPYVNMIGGGFIHHDSQQKAHMVAVDTKFPGFETVGDGFELMEEWYSLKDFAPNLHVLLVQDTKGMKGPHYQRAPYPATWARRHGKGRVFYTSMGHRPDVWANPLFQNILLGGIAWAVGNVEADVTPNLEKAAPGYAELPPKPEAKPKPAPKL